MVRALTALQHPPGRSQSSVTPVPGAVTTPFWLPRMLHAHTRNKSFKGKLVCSRQSQGHIFLIVEIYTEPQFGFGTKIHQFVGDPYPRGLGG